MLKTPCGPLGDPPVEPFFGDPTWANHLGTPFVDPLVEPPWGTPIGGLFWWSLLGGPRLGVALG